MRSTPREHCAGTRSPTPRSCARCPPPDAPQRLIAPTAGVASGGMFRVLSLGLLVAGLLLLPTDLALAEGLQFSAPLQLPHGDPNVHPFMTGGEPSLGFDPNGDGHVYVTAPEFVPAQVNNAVGATDSPVGVAYWASDDAGKSWPRSGLTGTRNGGGDSDVEVLRDHTVLTADLEATAAAICISKDFAKTFPNCDGGFTNNQQGPENDREWLTRGTKPGEVYLTYHDFTAGFPIIERSDDGGQTFHPCGTIIDPAGPAAGTYTPQGGTLVSKPLVGKDGSVYVEFTTPEQNAPPIGAKLNHLYMAVAKGGCPDGTRFTNYAIYTDPGADLAKIFQASALDGGGQLYVLTGGMTKADQPNTNLWLFTSTDGGKTWSAPVAVNPPELKANVFPTIAGGPNRGQVAFSWFGTATSGDPNTATNQWRVYAGESLDGGRSIAYATVTPDPLHYGDICTQGIFCGLIPGEPGNRNLADFESIAVNPADGCAAIAMPGDPYNRPDLPNGPNNFFSSAYFSRETSKSACFRASNAGRPAGTITGPRGAISTCSDRIAPVSRVTSSVVTRRRAVTLRGRSSDRGCGRNGAGKVRRVRVAVGRLYANQQCRFLKPNNRFGPRVSCLRTTYLSTRGTTRWWVRLKRRLPRGRYVVWVRGIDAAGNVEHKARRVNLGRFRVR